MNFGLYLLAIFCPPLYFLTRKRFGVAFLHILLFCVAVVCFVTFVFAVFGLLLWAFCSIHAIWNVRRELIAHSAELLATKMAEKMRAQPLPLEATPPMTKQ